jgi:hypothetical protein
MTLFTEQHFQSPGYGERHNPADVSENLTSAIEYDRQPPVKYLRDIGGQAVLDTLLTREQRERGYPGNPAVILGDER